MLVYGIPNFKMRKSIVDEYIAYLEGARREFVCNTYVGRDITVDDMLDGEFDAVFLGTGAGVGNEYGDRRRRVCRASTRRPTSSSAAT